MTNRYACINDMPIREEDRKFHGPFAGITTSTDDAATEDQIASPTVFLLGERRR